MASTKYNNLEGTEDVAIKFLRTVDTKFNNDKV